MKQTHANLRFRLPFIVLALLLPSLSALAAPKVVVSILPLHSLVSGIMQGVAEPDLLIRGGQSPHDFSLRPSDMRQLQRAELAVWIGPELETSLSSLFAKGHFKGEVVTLTQVSGIERLPFRDGAEWETTHHQHPDTDTDHHDHATNSDSHLWLSPAIAHHMVSHISDRLCELDPANAARYRQNSRRLSQRLTHLDTELASMLSSVSSVPYVVFHDAYHYFEHHYGLHAVGCVSLGPQRQPGARHVHELREKIARLQARCVFAEPQFQPKLVATLIDGTQAKAGQLDPLGSDLDTGPDAYFLLMRRLARNLVDCLQ